MNNRIFFQHPDLMRLLKVHEDVMTIMMNILTAQQGTAEHAEHEGGEQTSAGEANKVYFFFNYFMFLISIIFWLWKV